MSEYSFPKVELHLHLDGALRVGTTLELAEALGVPVPGGGAAGYRAYVDKAANCGGVNEYLKLFELPLQLMQTADALTRITRELIEDLAADDIFYAEIRFAPQLHCRGGLTQRQAVEAVLEGRRQGLERRPDIGIGILLCMMCVGPETANWAENAETVELAGEYLGRGVAGVDLAGAEGIVPLEKFAPLFARARALEIPFTCHAGDSQGPDTVRAAMDFGARRIGHGHHIVDDPALCRRAAEEGVTLEICPTSNIQCRTQPSYAQHPAKRLLDGGVPVTISTDNRTLAGVTLSQEYGHCLEEMGFTVEDLRTMNRYAALSAFLPDAEKLRLLQRLFIKRKP